MPRSIITNWLGRSALCAVLLAAIGTKAAAQVGAMPAIPPGTRIRVTSPTLGPKRQVVTVLRLHADTFVVRAEGRQDSTAFPLADVTRLELSRGKHTRVWKGTAIGALSGMALGAVISNLAYKTTKPDTVCSFLGCVVIGESRSRRTTNGGSSGFFLGAVAGAVGGAVWRAETWRSLAIVPRGTSLRVVPARGGLALSAAF